RPELSHDTRLADRGCLERAVHPSGYGGWAQRPVHYAELPIGYFTQPAARCARPARSLLERRSRWRCLSLYEFPRCARRLAYYRRHERILSAISGPDRAYEPVGGRCPQV